MCSPREERSPKAQLLQVRRAAHRRQLNPPGGSLVGLQHQGTGVGGQEYCPEGPGNQSQGAYRGKGGAGVREPARRNDVGRVPQILGEPKRNRRLAAEITLQNPLPETLQDCCFSIEGANLTGGRIISERLAAFGSFAQVIHEAFSRPLLLFGPKERLLVRKRML